MKKSWAAGAALAAIACSALGIFAFTHTHLAPVLVAKAMLDSVPPPRALALPAVGSWKPNGERHASPVETRMADAGVWRERHGDGRNSDETLLAGAPTFGPALIIGQNELYFSAISFDRESNIYASPSVAMDGVFLQSYDIETGELRWRITTGRAVPAGGVPIILPNDAGGETVYQMSRDEAMAVDTNGNILWRSDTGLPKRSDKDDVGLMWGPSYNPGLDIVTGVSGTGEFVAFDRESGELLTRKPLHVPGAPSPKRDVDMPSQLLLQLTEGLEKALDRPLTTKVIERVLRVVQGDGINIANYHSIDPETGRLWLSATAPDEADGKADGTSEYGALYGIDIFRDEADGGIGLAIACEAYFNGGSASTPGVRGDGRRIYVADGEQHLIAYDSDCRKLWSVEAGAQIVASPSVALDNNEIYIITAVSLLKVIDEDSSARIEWSAAFDMYDASFPLAQKNLLTAAIAANGIYAQAGLGVATRPGSERPGFLPLRRGGARLDRQTGEVLWYAESTGDSVAVTEIAPNGSLVIPQSPIRSVLAGIAFPGLEGEVTGGIAVFAPDRPELLVLDAACAALPMMEQAMRAGPTDAGESFKAHALVLIRQASDASGRTGKFAPFQSMQLAEKFRAASAAIEAGRMLRATGDLASVCGELKQATAS
ncbi:PQQ-binding-like beta-propeller repeat protein [Parvibaculum sp.]|uniref:outer membrane protein assembly factor BamB family protein n=1 Tax=Parvibaculum sp. TaxID=2024848 RepID=UPI00272EF663|nr:PQQ-binding-like beta-propeller repeat protein [Parvibaculum sp.]MDP1626580.1 PQQ-binding-like beta-propeller repeat protein [Parvibaculum sp.]MDP2150502.1 PQQ-binding-like beta-propeller repeat protein [Parvibaculum sp.]MDP3327012.1 PQQ-binding-like beta-propeller repeat protein [Parvibaculum sp.]